METSNPSWMRLDNAAKIYPAARRRNWSAMFRLSATLSHPVDPQVLQSALEVTVKRFPSIAVRLRRGLFWYYLENITAAPQVMPEAAYPCTPMHPYDVRKCAFRVLYYENRIAVEIFHALTDGSGGLCFLKTLVAEYLTQKYGEDIPPTFGVLDRNEPPQEEELEDSFVTHSGSIASSRKEENAYQIKGIRETDNYLTVTTGIVNTGYILEVAKSYGVSLNTFLVSVMIACLIELQNEQEPSLRRQKPVKVMVPVNLRKMYDSSTLRNFSLYLTPGINPRTGEFTFEDILNSVMHQIGAELTKNQLTAKITANVKTEQVLALKVMPLFIKNIAMKMAYNIIGEKKSTITISNLGQIHLPAEMGDYVRRMDFILGILAVCPYNVSALSYGGNLNISFIRNIEQSDLERKFFTYLRKLGLHVLIESNQRYSE